MTTLSGHRADPLPLTRMAPDDPRARCDALTPEQLDTVMDLTRMAHDVLAFCTAALTERPPGSDWLDVDNALRAAATRCRRHTTIEGNTL